jgi:hypothetical protein
MLTKLQYMPLKSNHGRKGCENCFIIGTGNEKARMTVMLSVLTEGHKMPPYVILQRKTMPKKKLLAGLICQRSAG